MHSEIAKEHLALLGKPSCPMSICLAVLEGNYSTYQKRGLLKIQRCFPVIAYDNDKTQCDFDTVKVFVNNRFQVLSSYARDVMKGVYREELRTSSKEYRKLIKQAKRLLVLDGSGLTEVNRQRLSKFLETNTKIATVYAMKESLHNIASRSSSSYEQMCESLEDWCQRAEASGIEALTQFSTRLKGSVVN